MSNQWRCSFKKKSFNLKCFPALIKHKACWFSLRHVEEQPESQLVKVVKTNKVAEKCTQPFIVRAVFRSSLTSFYENWIVFYTTSSCFFLMQKIIQQSTASSSLQAHSTAVIWQIFRWISWGVVSNCTLIILCNSVGLNGAEIHFQ